MPIQSHPSHPDHGSLLPVLRALYRSYAAVDKVSARHIESLGLTQARFDVLSTLGAPPGMTVEDLCEAAIITKGTLLHVIASLESQGLIERKKGEQDQRQTLVSLTPKGQTSLVALLRRLEAVFSEAGK